MKLRRKSNRKTSPLRLYITAAIEALIDSFRLQKEISKKDIRPIPSQPITIRKGEPTSILYIL